MGLDARESTPGFKRQLVLLNAELRSLKRTAIVAKRVLEQRVSTNTIERICLDVADDILAAEQSDWKPVITGEITVPSLAIVEFDGGRIRTRKTDCGPGVHLESSGWNETKNAIFVSAVSTPSNADPDPSPPRCFLDPEHVAELAESEKTSKNTRSGNAVDPAAGLEPSPSEPSEREAHKPHRLLRTLLSSLQPPKEFGKRMKREAKRGDSMRHLAKRSLVMVCHVTGGSTRRTSTTTCRSWILSMQ